MKKRFADLTKVPKQPASRLLAMANAKLKTPVSGPANAGVSDVLVELAKSDGGAEALVDMLRLLSIALPARERTWWACLAARDVIGTDIEKLPLPLEAAEKWVRNPSDEHRDAVRAAIDLADIDDDTVLCATAVIFCDETLGTGDLAQYPAPPGAAQSAAFAMNVMAIDKLGDDVLATCNLLVDRAVDIARGGNGNVAVSPPAPESKAQPS